MKDIVLRRRKRSRPGVIVPNGAILKPHELATVVLLTELGFDVTLIPKSNRYGEHTADIKMAGVEWEIKSPKGKGKYLIQNTLHKAATQSENVIIDLRRIKLNEECALMQLKKEFPLSKRLQRMVVVTKRRKLLTFGKK